MNDEVLQFSRETVVSVSHNPFPIQPSFFIMSNLFEAFRRFQKAHEALKNRIHNGFRYPLPPAGRAFMGFVYFVIPVVGGWHVMQWAIAKSHDSIGANGERLPDDLKVKAGNQTKDGSLVGAGGWGGGVHLARSDPETQDRNGKMLRRFLRQQRRKIEKEEGDKTSEH